MEYLHDPYHTAPQGHPILYHPSQFNHFAPPPPPSPYDGYFTPYGSVEYTDFGPHGLVHDEYEEGVENLTRPRLTKEQVDVLETQFQAHPKPNSMVKRQLATQTKLTLPRVANWFQNRRAKAKQQKKQEEFENNQGLGSLQEAWKSESSLPHRPLHHSQHSMSTQERRDRSSTETAAVPPTVTGSSMPAKVEEVAEDKSWASLQKALQREHEARQQAAQLEQNSMPPPALPRQMQAKIQSPSTAKEEIPSAAPVSDFSDWNNVQTSTPWSVPQPSVEPAQFDFAFDPLEDAISSGSEHTPTGSHDALPAQNFTMDANWNESLHHPIPLQQPVQLTQLSSASTRDMSFPVSRRGSTADELTNNFNTFDLANATSPPVNQFPVPPQRTDSGESVDLATRRKRPRPAALGSAAIRSRSYGALSSMSPTLRANSQAPAAHTVRHVKSTGHNLNVRYAGIRKSNSAQRSPLHASSFAEAEAFRRLMMQQTLVERSNEGTCENTPLMSPEIIMNTQIPQQDQRSFHTQDIPTTAQYPPSASSYYSAFASPPVTPYRPEYYVTNPQQNLMPPVSAGPQYATFPDYTPPYSAGPLTSSSWSDAPLTSPDLPTFQLMSHMPSMAYSMTHDMATGQYRNVIPSPDKVDVSPTFSEQKKTEFFIHEFPGQKEEHANVAQQLAQQKPKNYVFANATPSDY